MTEAVLLSWSGGKDSAAMLLELRMAGELAPAGLLTTFTEDGRSGGHRVRRKLIERQAEEAGLPLRPVLLPEGASNAVYEAAMAEALNGVRERGIRRVAFGDLHLASIRDYRERQMAELGMEAVFPLWGRDTAAFARHVLRLGFEATLVCVDTERLDSAFAGRHYDESLLHDLPPEIDPCGENGEFHTFVHGGPVFRRPIEVHRGGLVDRGRFMFLDLLPGRRSPG
jgi:uncharacterized protein (TIGR00290 family)